MEDSAVPDHELFGTLRLLRGGKHGYVGVRGGQGKKRDRFQAYASVNSQKVTVPGLFCTAHAAAVALAQWKQQRELGLAEEPQPKKCRKSRAVKATEQPWAACCSQTPRMPLQLLHNTGSDSTSVLPAVSPVTTAAVQLPSSVPAAAYGVPVALGQLA